MEAMSSVQLQEELDKALQSVEQAKKAYEDACKQGIFARFSEAAKSKKEHVSETEAYVTDIRGALFKAKQSETLGSLSKESLDALAMYYDTSNPDTPVTYTGQYAKEQVLQAFEKQGLGTDDATFSKVYEYYRFAADEQRAALKQSQLQEQYADASGIEKVGMNLETVATAPARGLSAMSEMIEAGLGYHDENAPLNINDRAFDLTNFSNTVRNETSKNIAEATNNSGVADFAYNTTMSIGDNVMTMTTMAGVGQAGILTSMGANAASESAKDATLRGVGVEDALKTGLASGAVEMAAEKLPLDNMMKLVNGTGKETVETVVKNVLKQSSIEGVEEAATTLGNTVTDYAINGDYSKLNRNIRSYMESGMSVSDAIAVANKDMAKDMAEAAASGFISGGVIGGGSYTVNGVTVGTEKVLNENYKQDIEGVIHYKTDQSVEARGWQGMDSFPGKDDYENRVLEGSKQEVLLAKLHFSSSGYFMLYDQYNALKGEDGKASAIEISEGVQVAPWFNKNTKQYEYQGIVDVYKVDKRLEVALGEKTLANPQYGKGGMVQVYIAGFDSKNQANNELIGLKKIGEEQLKDTVISEEAFYSMRKVTNYHVAKRDLFLLQSTKEKMLETKAAATDPEVIKNCDEYLEKLDGGIDKVTKQVVEYKKSLGNMSSTTYDDIGKYMTQKNELGNMEIQPQLEAKTSEVRNDLMQQIEKNLYKSIDKRDIEITEHLKTVYEADVYSQLESLTQGAEMQKLDLRTPLMDLGFNTEKNNEKIELFPKLRIEKIGDDYVFCEPIEAVKGNISLEKISAQVTKGMER